MNPTITAVIESLLNPQGRFRTLKRIIPETDSRGTPVFTFSADTACFEVTVNGNRCLLRIPMGWNEKQRINAAHEAIRTATAQGYVARCEYLDNEITTFDSHGRAVRSDIIVEYINSATPLISFLRMNLDRRGDTNVRCFLVALEATHGFMCSSSLYHGYVRVGTIMVTQDNKPLLLDYLHTRSRKPESDYYSLLYIAFLVFVVVCEPSLHYYMMHMNGDDKNRFMKSALLQAEFSRDEEFAGIIRKLLNGSLLSAESTAAALHFFAGKTFAPMPLLVSLIDNKDDLVRINYAKDFHASYDAGNDSAVTVDFGQCDFVGGISDTMVRYKNGKLWGYADRHGHKLGEAVYFSAEDFYEGRAAVVDSEGGHGLIDRAGSFVMQPVYESLEWYGEDNTVVASADGKWKLYDRCGGELSPHSYDWVGDPCERTFIVKRGSKYGFVRAGGKPLTELRFDEAFSFSGGKALVNSEGRSFYIDAEGKKI